MKQANKNNGTNRKANNNKYKTMEQAGNQTIKHNQQLKPIKP